MKNGEMTMMSAEQARRRSRERRWTAIVVAITDATNDGEDSVIPSVYVGDDEAKELMKIGYHITPTDTISGNHRETVISWEE